MKFASTRNPQKLVSFKDTVFQGLAPDGGLYVPTTMPDMSKLFEGMNEKTSFVDIAETITKILASDELSPDAISRIAKRAFPFLPELKRLTENIHILELFHGPSCAFKDFGASFLATTMEEFLNKEERKAIILTATSGDTGSAVAQAFFGKKNINVVILYPSGRVSPLQEKQLTTVGGNVTALEVKGSFDDCQNMVKKAFVNPKLISQLPLTSANSINLGRLVPQAFYYIYGFTRTKKSPTKATYFCVPSGNFGNLTAGIYAWKWGLPVKGFIAATNINDVVPEYLQSGLFKARPSVQTLSNAMDVGNPSNFERLMALFANDWNKIRTVIYGEVVSDTETLETIRKVYEEYHIFIDPHTAVGILAAERFNRKSSNDNSDIIVLSTAHPGKFLETVEEATGKKPQLPDALARALKLPKQSVLIENSSKALENFLLDTFT